MINLSVNLTRHNIAPIADELETWLAHQKKSAEPTIGLNFAQVQCIDSAGAALLSRFVKRVQRLGGHVEAHNLQEHLANSLQLFPFLTTMTTTTAANVGLTEQLGSWGISTYNKLGESILICSEIYSFIARGILQKSRLSSHEIWVEMAFLGSQALGVVSLIAFLVGATVAIQSAEQLRQFGANMFVVDLLGVSITRELGPLMTAMVIAGRSGSAIAAEIGTMVITEEIDALKTMGINPLRFLIAPKVVAISITQPVLTMWADMMAILGGFLIATFSLDIAPATFFSRLQGAVYNKDILVGLFKSLLFANFIAIIGALCGLYTTGGADMVGRNTTKSVVLAIFAIVFADAACSLIFYFSG